MTYQPGGGSVTFSTIDIRHAPYTTYNEKSTMNLLQMQYIQDDKGITINDIIERNTLMLNVNNHIVKNLTPIPPGGDIKKAERILVRNYYLIHATRYYEISHNVCALVSKVVSLSSRFDAKKLSQFVFKLFDSDRQFYIQAIYDMIMPDKLTMDTFDVVMKKNNSRTVLRITTFISTVTTAYETVYDSKITGYVSLLLDIVRKVMSDVDDVINITRESIMTEEIPDASKTDVTNMAAAGVMNMITGKSAPEPKQTSSPTLQKSSKKTNDDGL